MNGIVVFPQIHSHPETQNVPSFGNRIFAAISEGKNLEVRMSWVQAGPRIH